MKKKGQVWVETITYTLIAFVMIGLVLSFIKPKLEEMQDKAILEQSVRMLKEIDVMISEVGEGVIGNKRKLELNLKKGSLEISSENDSIIFKLDSRHIYSEPGQEYIEGNLAVLTMEKGKYNKVTITRNYENLYNITYKEKEDSKIITKAPNPYNFFISNKGGSQIDIEIE